MMPRRAILPALAAGLFALAAHAQNEQGIGLADNKGNFYSVTQRYGNHAYFQVTKLSLTGQVQWNVPYDPGTDVSPAALAIDPDGNVIVAGTIKDQAGKSVLLVKFTPGGAMFWNQKRSASGGYAIPTVIVTDYDGNIYVGATVSESSGSFLKVMRFNTAGSLYWEQPYRAGRTNYARSMVVDRNGDAHVTVETYFGDPRFENAQVRQVIFTVNGAVVPQ